MIRAFVALFCPDPLADALASIDKLPFGRAVLPENMHLTLAVLGEHPEQALEDLHFELEAIRLAPFTLEAAQCDFFGGADPRQLYMAFKPSEPLKRLHGAVRRSARNAGITLRHKRFIPHVTMRRFSDRPDSAALSETVRCSLRTEFPIWNIDAFDLIQSHRSPDGPRYVSLARYPFALSHRL